MKRRKSLPCPVYAYESSNLNRNEGEAQECQMIINLRNRANLSNEKAFSYASHSPPTYDGEQDRDTVKFSFSSPRFSSHCSTSLHGVFHWLKLKKTSGCRGRDGECCTLWSTKESCRRYLRGHLHLTAVGSGYCKQQEVLFLLFIRKMQSPSFE